MIDVCMPYEHTSNSYRQWHGEAVRSVQHPEVCLLQLDWTVDDCRPYESYHRLLEAGSNEFVCWVNGDDVAVPTFFDSALRELKADSDLSGVFSQSEIVIRETKTVWRPFFDDGYAYSLEHHSTQINAVHELAIFRRSAYEQVKPMVERLAGGTYLYEKLLYFAVGCVGSGWRYVPETGYKFRRHGNNQHRRLDWIPLRSQYRELTAQVLKECGRQFQ